MSENRFPARAALAGPLDHLGQVPERVAALYGDKAAFQLWRDGAYRTWSFAWFGDRVPAQAAHLAGLGLESGDRVALIGDNSPEWYVAYFAIARLGAVAVPLDPQLTPSELAVFVKHAEAKAAFAGERFVADMREAIGPDAPIVPLTPEAFTVTPDAPPPAAAGSRDRLAVIIYTSGTTGRPKGVMLSHGNLLSNMEACAGQVEVLPQDKPFCLLPLHHAYAFTVSVVGLCSGVPTVFPHSMRPDVIASTLRETGVTWLPAVPLLIDHLAKSVRAKIAERPAPIPTVVEALLTTSRLTRALFGVEAARLLCRPILAELGGLRQIIAGGAPLNPETVSFFTSLGVTVYNGYGLTETSPVATFTPGHWWPGDGVGKPLPGVEVRIDAPDANGVGEVLIRGENVMAGYYGDPEGTAEAIRDGWLHTGDLGAFDARGYLTLSGRSKNVIVLPNGKNVHIEDLEAHYGGSPLIAELCVIHGRDEAGEYPFGVLVANGDALAAKGVPEAEWGAALKAEVRRLSDGVAEYRRLRRFELVDGPLPRTTTRKVKRHMVQSMYRFEGGTVERVATVPAAAAAEAQPEQV